MEKKFATSPWCRSMTHQFRFLIHKPWLVFCHFLNNILPTSTRQLPFRHITRKPFRWTFEPWRLHSMRPHTHTWKSKGIRLWEHEGRQRGMLTWFRIIMEFGKYQRTWNEFNRWNQKDICLRSSLHRWLSKSHSYHNGTVTSASHSPMLVALNDSLALRFCIHGGWLPRRHFCSDLS